MFDIKVIIPEFFDSPPGHDFQDPEDILTMASVLEKPSMFRYMDWEIIDRNTGEVLVSWDADNEKEKVSPIIFEALKGTE